MPHAFLHTSNLNRTIIIIITVTLLPEPTDDIPYLVNDSDSDDDDGDHDLNRPAEEIINQYGNDFCIRK